MEQLLVICMLFVVTQALDLSQTPFGEDTSAKTTCSCGWTNKGRIIGGTETGVNEFPMMAALVAVRADRFQFCGAVIVTEWHALTAAHCLAPIRRGNITIELNVGDHDIFDSRETNNQNIPVVEMIDHPNYTTVIRGFDLTLLVLGRKIIFSQTIGPACLPKERLDLTGERIRALGWGSTTADHQNRSSVLLQADLPTLPIARCSRAWLNLLNMDPPIMICTFRLGRDICTGDSGGPLLWLDPETNRQTVVGISSFGRAVCGSATPSVHTDVSAFLDWINDEIAKTNKGVHTCSKI